MEQDTDRHPRITFRVLSEGEDIIPDVEVAWRRTWALKRKSILEAAATQGVSPSTIAESEARSIIAAVVQRFSGLPRSFRGRLDVDVWSSSVFAPRFMVDVRAYVTTLLLGIAPEDFADIRDSRADVHAMLKARFDSIASALWLQHFRKLAREWDVIDRPLFQHVVKDQTIPEFDLTLFRKAIWEGGNSVTGDGPVQCVVSFLSREIVYGERIRSTAVPSSTGGDCPESISTPRNRSRFEALKRKYEETGRVLTQGILTVEAGYESKSRTKSNTEVKNWLKGDPRSTKSGRQIDAAMTRLEREVSTDRK